MLRRGQNEAGLEAGKGRGISNLPTVCLIRGFDLRLLYLHHDSCIEGDCLTAKASSRSSVSISLLILTQQHSTSVHFDLYIYLVVKAKPPKKIVARLNQK